MGSRVPGPIGVVLGQSPRPADARARPTVTGGGAAIRSGLIARASVHAPRSKAARGFHCLRGETITLDSLGSSSNARDFEWRFAAAEVPVAKTGQRYSQENPPPVRSVEGSKSGKRVTVVALASFTATLVVKDAVSESPPASVEVRVQPRDWTTRFVPRPQPKFFSKYYGTNADERLSGFNACTECGGEVKNKHWIHRRSDRTDWKQQFRIARVDDPGAPFHGLWYVEKLDLHIDRTIYVNSELTTGQVFRINNRPGIPNAYREDLKARVECTKLHEGMHGDLVKEALAKTGVDPAPRVELLIGEDEASLAEQANTEVAITEGTLSDATAGPEGHGALRERLRSRLTTTKLKFLLPSSHADAQGVEVETDLLAFED